MQCLVEVVEICAGCHTDAEVIDNKSEDGRFCCIFVKALCGQFIIPVLKEASF